MAILYFAMTETKKKRLGEILIEDGILSPESLDEALNHQKKEGGLIGQILIRLGYVTEEELIAAVGKQLRIPYIPLMSYSVNSDTALKLGVEFCRRALLLPFDQDEKNVFLAMGDPLNDTAVGEVEKKCGLKAQIFISTPTEILNMVELIFNAAKKEVKKAG